MGQIVRCPLNGAPCNRPIQIPEDTFFLAESPEPVNARDRRRKAITEAVGERYHVRSALDENQPHDFTCRICEMIQSCTYGLADISGNDPGVLLELGILLAMGKPTIILTGKNQQGLNLPADLNGIITIAFDEYIDVIDQLRRVIPELPKITPPPTPIDDIVELRPDLAAKLKHDVAESLRAFRSQVFEAEMDTISLGTDTRDVAPGFGKGLADFENTFSKIVRLGFDVDSDTLKLRGNYCFNRGEYEKAIASYNWALEQNPEETDLPLNRGLARMRLNRFPEAMADFNHVLTQQPETTTALIGRAVCYANQEDYDAALGDLNRALALEPENPVALDKRGAIYANLRKYEEALADLNRALEIKPDYASALGNRGIVYTNLEKDNVALADLNRALEIKPDDAVAFDKRGIVYTNLERYDEALTDYGRALEIEPDDPVTLYNRAVAYAEQGKYEEALTDYSSSLEIKPNDTAALCNRGNVLTNLGQYERALADLNRALELKPDYPAALGNRGITYTFMGMHSEALSDYRRSLQLEPEDANILYNLACVLSLLGEKDEAITSLDKAISLDADNRELAAEDSDFDAVRETPAFARLMGAAATEENPPGETEKAEPAAATPEMPQTKSEEAKTDPGDDSLPVQERLLDDA